MIFRRGITLTQTPTLTLTLNLTMRSLEVSLSKACLITHQPSKIITLAPNIPRERGVPPSLRKHHASCGKSHQSTVISPSPQDHSLFIWLGTIMIPQLPSNIAFSATCCINLHITNILSSCQGLFKSGRTVAPPLGVLTRNAGALSGLLDLGSLARMCKCVALGLEFISSPILNAGKPLQSQKERSFLIHLWVYGRPLGSRPRRSREGCYLMPIT